MQNNTAVLAESCQPLFLPLVIGNDNTASRSATADTVYNYQLILEGIHGWGVFDALKLEAANTVIWTIGFNDESCQEFDHENFNPCN